MIDENASWMSSIFLINASSDKEKVGSKDIFEEISDNGIIERRLDTRKF